MERSSAERRELHQTEEGVRGQQDGVPLRLQVAHEELVAALEVTHAGRVARVGLVGEGRDRQFLITF